MKQKIIINYTPRKEQEEIHALIDKNRFSVIVAHRRLGKTFALLQHMVKASFSVDSYNGIYCSPSYRQAKMIAWDYLLKITEPIPARKINIAELTVKFFDKTITLVGNDQGGDNLRGLSLDFVCLDEFGDQNPSILQVIYPALADRKGKLVFIGTPKGNNAFKQYRDKAYKEEKNWGVLEFKASDTGIIDQEELDLQKKVLGDKFSQEFEISFDAPVEGSYYGKIINEIEQENKITNLPKDDLITNNVVSWDLGMSDSTALWVAQIIGKEIRLIDCMEHSGAGLDFYVNWLRDNDYLYYKNILPHDVQVRELGSGKSRKQILEEHGLNVQVAPRLSVADGIQAVRQILPRCWFDKKTESGLDSLKNYRREFNDKAQVFYDRPLHNWTSHYADSFRYLAISLDETSESWSKPLKVNTDWIV